MKTMKPLLLALCLYLATAATLFAVPADGVSDDDVRTPDYYEEHVREAFSAHKWKEGKSLLDEGLAAHPNASALNELAGRYHYHLKSYDDARFYLVKALRNNSANTRARQLLIDVEEATGYYSSAICYVNELLEQSPYQRDLWRRKINLYRLQGNNGEADRLLRRIRQIYPNDEQLQNDYTERLDGQYRAQRTAGDRAAAIATLRELVSACPDREDYYLALSNLLQQGETDAAAAVAGSGATALPHSDALITKKAGILAGQERYAEAMAYVRECMKTNRSAALASFYDGLLAEAARAESQRDPYALSAKVYATQKTRESLDYLLNTAISRGYDEDALYYIGEARRRDGDTPQLLYKAYLVNKRLGNTSTANGLLARLYNLTPADTDVADELSRVRLQQGADLMADGEYAEAVTSLQFAAAHTSEPETRRAAWSKILACQTALHRYTAALSALDSLYAGVSDKSNYEARKAALMDKQGRPSEALALLRQTLDASPAEPRRYACVTAYEEIAVPHIKRLIENGAIRRAYDESVRLLAVCPDSEEGLRYAVNTSAQLGLRDDFARYVGQGRSRYPDDNFFLVKQAEVFYAREDYPSAISLLRPRLADYSGDTALIGAHSMNSEAQAYALVKAHRPEAAVAVVDTALLYDPSNRDLIYAKGIAYERAHRYDSAYVCQSQYRPDASELGATATTSTASVSVSTRTS